MIEQLRCFAAEMYAISRMLHHVTYMVCILTYADSFLNHFEFLYEVFLAFRYFRSNKLNNGEITSWGFDFIWTATVVFHLNDVTVVFNLIKMCFIGSAKKTLSLMVRTKSSNGSPSKNSDINTPLVVKIK